MSGEPSRRVRSGPPPARCNVWPWGRWDFMLPACISSFSALHISLHRSLQQYPALCSRTGHCQVFLVSFGCAWKHREMLRAVKAMRRVKGYWFAAHHRAKGNKLVPWCLLVVPSCWGWSSSWIETNNFCFGVWWGNEPSPEDSDGGGGFHQGLQLSLLTADHTMGGALLAGDGLAVGLGDPDLGSCPAPRERTEAPISPTPFIVPVY